MFILDITDLKLTIAELKDTEIASLKKYYKTKDLLSLENYDFKFFETEKKAEKFRSDFITAKKTLETNFKTKEKKLKASILYKQRYLVQTLMNKKLQTYRDSDRVNKMMSRLEIGDEFYLYDQKHFLPVQLTKVTKIDDHTVKYDFKNTK